MNNINLLPENLGVKNANLKAAGLIKQIAALLLGLFLVLGAGALSYFLVLTRQINTSNASQESLKARLENLSTVEQQYVLVKDRVKKINQLTQDTSVEEALDNFEGLQNFLPSEIGINEVQVRPDKTEITFFATSSQSVVNFFDSLLGSGIYERVVLKSFGFNPATGFLVSVEVI